MPFTGSTIPAQPVVSEATRSRMLLQQLVLQGLPQNRPLVAIDGIAIDANNVALADNFKNAQMLGISGEDAATGMPVTSSELWAKVSVITGGTFAERAILQSSIRSSTPIQIATQLIIGIITSDDIVITLTNGHGLSKLWFEILPASYLVNP